MRQLQRLHHLCLKVKHGFRSHHPRTFIRDLPLYRGVVDVLVKEGFLAKVQPGDTRGPFVDILATAQTQRLNVSTHVLTPQQMERLEMLQRMQAKLAGLHAAVGSDGLRSVSLTDQHRAMTLDDDTAAVNKVTDYAHGRHRPLNTDKALLKAMKVLPALSTIHVPSLNGSAPLTAHDLELLTWPKDRRLWLDLRYDRYEQPALTDMFLVSRGSRRVRTTVEELEAVLSGRKYNQWRGSDVGAVTMLKTDDGHIVTAWEALKRGVGGEVICVAK